MKLRTSGLLAIAALALTGFIGSAQSLAQDAYITNKTAQPHAFAGALSS
jgi:hypothetical protein